jgi:alginate O-acetyltransferase complex protein AlgI
MLFNTIDFVIFFIVVVTTITIIRNRKFQHLFILFSSYFFFYYSSNYYIALLIFTTIWDFYLGKIIWKTENIARKKMLLILSVSINLGLLGFFKYADFAIAQFNILGNHFNLDTQIPLLNLALPIGISFYTFHSVGYIIDVYRGHVTPSRSLREYATFIAFFPQLVAGPILRAGNFLPQLREKTEQFEIGTKLRQILIHNSNLKLGITMMALGFFKKMVIADNVSPLVNEIFSNPIGKESFTIILGAISFGIQIYSDFSGYTDIAIGAALTLGFKLPPNFNKPYFATSPSDFWRRWHISLSSWLRDYLYVSLGGNRKSKARTYLNLFITMFLGGLWHGAAWNFVVWGMLHGLYLALHKLILNTFPFLKNHAFFKTKFGFIFSIFVTQYLVFLTWIAFRVRNFDYMTYSMQKYVLLDFHIKNTLHFMASNKTALGIMAIFIILHFISYKKGNLPQRISELKLQYWGIFLIIIMSTIFLFFSGNTDDFIYFQF